MSASVLSCVSFPHFTQCLSVSDVERQHTDVHCASAAQWLERAESLSGRASDAFFLLFSRVFSPSLSLHTMIFSSDIDTTMRRPTSETHAEDTARREEEKERQMRTNHVIYVNAIALVRALH